MQGNPRHLARLPNATMSAPRPIPRSASARNVALETAIPIRVRPRLPSSLRPTPVAPPSRRPNPRAVSTYEPRVIRAHTAAQTTTPDVQCSSSTSVSPARPRRSSAVAARPSTAHPVGLLDRQPPPPAAPFPRPSYLEHSALRHLLLTETPPALPPMRKVDTSNIDVQLATARRRTSMSPSTDSDGESDRSPPRELPPAPPPPVLYDPVLRLPTRWSEQVRHPLLTVSGDGRDLTYHGASDCLGPVRTNTHTPHRSVQQRRKGRCSCSHLPLHPTRLWYLLLRS